MTLRVALPLAAAILLALPGTRLAAQHPAEERRTLELAEGRRSYLLSLPPSPDRPLPLVLVFHAAGGTGRGFARHTGFSRLGASEGFAVAYLDGIGGRWNDERRPGGGDDVVFVRAVLDTLGRELALDTARIYAAGMSNGAMFVHRLACDLPGVLAAIASVAGAMPRGVAQRCTGTAPVSLIALQGTADRSIPYEGGGSGRSEVLSAERTAAFWAGANGCTGMSGEGPAVDSVRDGTRLRRREYAGCASGRSVVLFTIDGGGHTWPGGPASARRVGAASRELDATETIWDFFQRHPRP